MFVERLIADQFWRFLYNSALDPRLDIPGSDRHRHTPDAFREFDWVLSWKFGTQMSHVDPRRAGMKERDDSRRYPRFYPTLQEALIHFQFLIRMDHQYMPADVWRFELSYEMWLRSVVVIVADIERNPACLELETFEPPDLTAVEWNHYEHTGPFITRRVEVADDWDCLSREVFDFVEHALTCSPDD